MRAKTNIFLLLSINKELTVYIINRSRVIFSKVGVLRF